MSSRVERRRAAQREDAPATSAEVARASPSGEAGSLAVSALVLAVAAVLMLGLGWLTGDQGFVSAAVLPAIGAGIYGLGAWGVQRR